MLVFRLFNPPKFFLGGFLIFIRLEAHIHITERQRMMELFSRPKKFVMLIFRNHPTSICTIEFTGQ